MFQCFQTLYGKWEQQGNSTGILQLEIPLDHLTNFASTVNGTAQITNPSIWIRILRISNPMNPFSKRIHQTYIIFRGNKRHLEFENQSGCHISGWKISQQWHLKKQTKKTAIGVIKNDENKLDKIQVLTRQRKRSTIFLFIAFCEYREQALLIIFLILLSAIMCLLKSCEMKRQLTAKKV